MRRQQRQRRRERATTHESSTGAGMRCVFVGFAVSMMATDCAAVSRMQMNAPESIVTDLKLRSSGLIPAAPSLALPTHRGSV